MNNRYVPSWSQVWAGGANQGIFLAIDFGVDDLHQLRISVVEQISMVFT